MIRFLAAAFIASSVFAADQSCPWLDAATAAGAVGTPVAQKLTSTSCEFVHKLPRGRSFLRIAVHRSGTAHNVFASHQSRCSAAVPLKGIGNEAFLCTKHHEITGRVRDAVFTVQLNTPDNPDLRVRQIAEAVAGSLF